MKKIVAILLLVIYGSTSVGATIHLHYCMNEFVGWDLKHDDKEKECGKCGMKEGKAGCCKDEHKQLKLSDDQNHNQLKGLVFNQFFTQVLLTYSYNYTFAQPATVAITFPKNNAPPPWRSVPIYLSNCVFLI